MSAYPAGPPNASKAVTAFVLGVLGVILCPLLGPVAWAMGRRGEQEVDSSAGTLGGRGLATAGKILGMIGTFFLALVIAGGLALLAGAPTAP